MIIHRLRLLNYGVYGQQEFDLTPHPWNDFSRPIILIRGKNGTGKTTIMEAIRLCLHGSLALGSRVSRSAYEDYLVQRIHISPNPDNDPSTARVELLLDYVAEGQRSRYRVEREWKVAGGNVKEYVRIWENGEELDDLNARDQKDSFLRELVPAGVAELFFFDAEKLYTLAENGTSSELLATTVRTLFGLHLVQRLQSDLDIYLSRQRANGKGDSPQDQLHQLTKRISALESDREDLQAQIGANERVIASKRRAISRQEQKIASEGGWFAERLESLKLKREELQAKIDMQRRQAQEATNGLMPFAVAPTMCLQVAERLHLEARYERKVAAQQALENQLTQVVDDLALSEFWDGTGVHDERTQRELISRLTSALKQAVGAPDIPEDEIILRESEPDRQALLSWIQQSTTQIPQEFCHTIYVLNDLEEELESVNEKMQLVPADETLQPLVEGLLEHNRELGVLQKTASDLEDELKSIDFQLEQLGYERKRLREQILQQERNNERIQLVGRTQRALEEYSERLRREKVALLEKELVICFNKLCRKEGVVDTIKIDAETLKLTLYRGQQPLEFEQLSAGERQLLAMATMWALRRVSGVPMPVVIDTPLGRLDSDHRLSVAQNYLPQASHQVLLLATDAEVDDRLVSQLTPAISHIYGLEYDPAQGETLVRQHEPPEAHMEAR
ncbi:MAG: DNA sulfur modification protein DndD [bacterium]